MRSISLSLSLPFSNRHKINIKTEIIRLFEGKKERKFTKLFFILKEEMWYQVLKYYVIFWNGNMNLITLIIMLIIK